MSDRFYPSINGISLRNYQIIENATMTKRVRGDIYLGNQCVGFYDPNKTSENSMPYMFLRIEDEHKILWDRFIDYKSMFTYDIEVDEETKVNKVGLGVLVGDLELLTIMCDFIQNIPTQIDNPIVGIINGDTFKCIQLQRSVVEGGRISILDFIRTHIPSLVLDDQYPVCIFKNQQDFTIVDYEYDYEYITESSNDE